MKTLTVMTCAMGGNIGNADFLRPIVASLGMKFVTISEWDGHDIKWDINTWLNHLKSADIVVCVQIVDLQPAKSNNRVTQAQSLGKPVCASPLAAYCEAIKDGVTGFICKSDEEWYNALKLLRDDEELRTRIGNAARQNVEKFYSLNSVGSFWVHVAKTLAVESTQPPKVDIIIPTWNNFKLLKECITSIHKNTSWPYNIIVVNSGTDETAKWIATNHPHIICHNSIMRLHFSHANNIGLKLSKAPYVCFLNDDTIVAERWLDALMHQAMKPNVGAVNPFSNCDKGWLHNEEWVVGGVDLHPGMKYEDVERIIPLLYTQTHAKSVVQREWVPFFCTVLPRSAIDNVGEFDEQFKTGCEDVDLCRRIASKGYKFYTVYDSVVFHFGGASRKNSENVNYDLHHDEDHTNQALLSKKYDIISRPIIRLYTGRAIEQWTPDSINNGGIGGSETSAVHVCRELAKNNYDVILYGNPPDNANVDYFGFKYLHYSKFDASDRSEVVISSRSTEIFRNQLNAKRKICWVHDIWLNHDSSVDICINTVDKFFVLSPWHQSFFCKHHNVPIEKTFITNDGIDLNRFNKQFDRIPGRMIYSSSPDRGLDVLLDSFPRIRSAIPHATLRVFYGFENWEYLIRYRNNQHEVNWMENIKHKLKTTPGVEYCGRIGQDKLAEEFLKSELWAYPTAFNETFCITACEAMAAGVPVVTSNLAALSTTVGVDGGVLIDGHNASELYFDNFVKVCTYVLSDKNVWNELSQRARRKSVIYDWSLTVKSWLKELS